MHFPAKAVTMRQREIRRLNVADLTALYEKEFQDLKMALLNGTEWDSVQEQRKKVTKIAHTLHQKFYKNRDNMDPSSFNSRAHS